MLSYFYCNHFGLSIFDNKFIKGIADSKRNLHKSTIFILKSINSYTLEYNISKAIWVNNSLNRI